MATFVAIVENGGLSAAAESLGCSAATVVRVLAELEAYLGVRLLNRTTRRIALTEEGRDYHLHCQRVLAEVQEMEFMLDHRKAVPTGKLSLTAPVMFGHQNLAPLLCEWLEANKGITAELALLDRTVDLLEEGFDLALRIGPMADSSLIAKPLGQIATVCCASPALVAKLGYPSHPKELADWPAVTFTGNGMQWAFQYSGDTHKVKVQSSLACNHIAPMLEAAKRGLGAVCLLAYQVEEAIKEGALVPILEAFAPPSLPVQFVYPHSRLLSPRVRTFLDWATPRLHQQLESISAANSACGG